MALIFRIGSRGYNALSKFVRVSKPRLSKFGKLAAVEMSPPTRGELTKALSGLKDVNLAKVSEMTINEVTARGLVLAEIAFWFYLGEMIGRGSIIGYNPKV